MFHGHVDYFQKPPLGGRPSSKLGDHGTLNAHNRWFIVFYHVWEPTWIIIHWNSIWLRVWSHMASHYNWGSVTTLHDVGGVFGLSQSHGHGSWLVCDVALSFVQIHSVSACVFIVVGCRGEIYGHVQCDTLRHLWNLHPHMWLMIVGIITVVMWLFENVFELLLSAWNR